MNELDRKIKLSIHLIKTLDGLCPELAYSGGKDSDVILELTKMSGIEFKPIYKMTTIDPPFTLNHVRAKGVDIVKPKLTFFEIIEKKGFPTRRARFCCSYLKEYAILPKSILGIRKAESIKRRKLYNEYSICRVFSANSRVEQFFPILDWSNNDISNFINYYNVSCHPLYYDTFGTFHVERRLGCLGCPLSSKNGLNDFKQYPNLVKAWIKHGKVYLSSHPNSNAYKIFGNAYNLFFHNVFCNSYEDYIYKTRGLFGDLDVKHWLEDYFSIDL